MKNIFTKLFKNLHRYSSGIPDIELKKLASEKAINCLRNIDIIIRSSDLEEIQCESCDLPHFIEVKNDESGHYYFCSESDQMRSYIKENQIITWDFNISNFISFLINELKLISDIEIMKVKNLWKVGVYSYKTDYEVYYLQNYDLQSAIDLIENNPSNKNTVIFTNKNSENFNINKQNLNIFEIGDFLYLSKAKLKFNKNALNKNLITSFRNVYFDTENGELTIEGRSVVDVDPGTDEYYFILFLWENFKYPVSHEEIQSFILKKQKKERIGKNFDEFTKSLKFKIKKSSKLPGYLEKIIKSSKKSQNENGYRMVNYEE